MNKNLIKRVGMNKEDAVTTVTGIQHKHFTSLLVILCFRAIQAAGARPRYKGARAIFQQCGRGG